MTRIVFIDHAAGGLDQVWVEETLAKARGWFIPVIGRRATPMLEPHDRRTRHSPRRRALLTCAFMLIGFPAAALSVKDCRDAGVGIESIVKPVETAHVALYEGKVDVYNIDTVEPACCSSGLAVVLPAKDDPTGGSQCWAVIGLASVDVTVATRSYDKAKGLLLVMPTRRGDENGGTREGPPLRLRINLGEGRVTLE